MGKYVTCRALQELRVDNRETHRFASLSSQEYDIEYDAFQKRLVSHYVRDVGDQSRQGVERHLGERPWSQRAIKKTLCNTSEV